MLKDTEAIIDFIKNISTKLYKKEIFFYDKDIDMWYSRIDCRYIKTTEVLCWIEDNIDIQ